MTIEKSLPNMVMVCVDGVENGDIYGRYFHRYKKEETFFPDSATLVIEMDTNEMLLSEALSQISGLKSLSARAESKGRILLTPSSLERKQTKGLIFESGK